jgi:hypothetical protein
MKIINISAIANPNFDIGYAIFGLGDDGKVYVWDMDKSKWNPF